jgi:hypothetical protein
LQYRFQEISNCITIIIKLETSAKAQTYFIPPEIQHLLYSCQTLQIAFDYFLFLFAAHLAISDVLCINSHINGNITLIWMSYQQNQGRPQVQQTQQHHQGRQQVQTQQTQQWGGEYQKKRDDDEDTLSLNSDNSQGFINEPVGNWPAWSVGNTNNAYQNNPMMRYPVNYYPPQQQQQTVNSVQYSQPPIFNRGPVNFGRTPNNQYPVYPPQQQAQHFIPKKR